MLIAHVKIFIILGLHNFIVGMNNPETSFHTIDTATMYSYNRGTNQSWNMSEYRTPKLEVDANMQVQKRKWQSQKKGQKDGRYLTKRGFYMDYDLKVAKSIPSPSSYQSQNPWDFTKLKKSGQHIKVDQKLIKQTYLQKIQLEQKNRKSPGISFYKLQKSFEEIEEQKKKMRQRKINVSEKRFFYQNTENLSNNVPGAGNYSPHPMSPIQRMDKSDYKFWVNKHKLQNDKLMKRQSIKPAPGTHNPLPPSITTFDQLSLLFKQPSKKRYFGADAKFEYLRDKKKVIVQQRPDPSVHSTIIQWKGKGSPKKTLLNEMIWKGHSQSVYH